LQFEIQNLGEVKQLKAEWLEGTLPTRITSVQITECNSSNLTQVKDFFCSDLVHFLLENNMHLIPTIIYSSRSMM